MRHFQLNRREFLFSSLALGTLNTPSSIAQPNKATAITGHRFQKGNDIFEIADIVSPDPNALLPNGRQFAGASREILQNILDKNKYTIEYTEHVHRWGYKLVHLIDHQNNNDIREQILLSGAARVFSMSEPSFDIEKLFAAETNALNNNRGLWALPFYRIRNANTLDDARDSVGAMHIFEGTIQKIGQFGARRFLNFGTDYKSDITATIEGRFARKWEKQWEQDNFKIADLEGKRVQFRGYVEWINGPSIALEHMQLLKIETRL